jgi:hypothetical protein
MRAGDEEVNVGRIIRFHQLPLQFPVDAFQLRWTP